MIRYYLYVSDMTGVGEEWHLVNPSTIHVYVDGKFCSSIHKLPRMLSHMQAKVLA